MTDFTIPTIHKDNKSAIIKLVRRYYAERLQGAGEGEAAARIEVYMTSLTRCYLHIYIPKLNPNPKNGGIEFEEKVVHDDLTIVPSTSGCYGVV